MSRNIACWYAITTLSVANTNNNNNRGGQHLTMLSFSANTILTVRRDANVKQLYARREPLSPKSGVEDDGIKYLGSSEWSGRSALLLGWVKTRLDVPGSSAPHYTST